MSTTYLPPIIEGAHGATLLSTWLILLREDWEFLDAFLEKRVSRSERAYELALTINHEGVHFIQGFTTAFTYSYSVALLNISEQIMSVSRAGHLTPDNLRRFKQSYANYQKQFRKGTRGISATDLLEAVAVTESFRATWPDLSSQAFVDYLLNYYPHEDSVYRRVIDVVNKEFGGEAALNLTPRLCFIALNGDDPPAGFWHMVDVLRHIHIPEIFSLSAWDLAEFFGMDTEGILLKQFKLIPPEGEHRVLLPYLEYLSKLGPYKEIFEFAARPGDRLRQETVEDPRWLNLVPPLIMTSGGRGRVVGLGRTWSETQLFQHIDSAALVGACERLLTDENPYQCCPHTECPVHESALCHAWYPVPQRMHWSECGFPKRIKVQFGQSAEQLTEIRMVASGEDQ